METRRESIFSVTRLTSPRVKISARQGGEELGGKKVFRSFIPKGIKNAIKNSMGITALREEIEKLQERLDHFQDIFYEEDIWERSKRRWRASEPEKGLTWGQEISGDPFIKKLQHYAPFNKNSKILEIGPGYGRLLKSILGMKLEFERYVGLDISEKNICFLKATCPGAAVEFVLGDVECFPFDEKFDTVFSSLTFKHLFPTFEKALQNLARCLNRDGIILFDLLEGDSHMFEADRVTFLHGYSKEKVGDILEKVPLELVAFDQVEHLPGFVRLLVVARKKGAGDN
jgi:SAM-dependent methyltransferase